jgi:hypothetical protein
MAAQMFIAVIPLLAVLSQITPSRALQRLYGPAWRLEKRGLRDSRAGLQWVPGLVVYGCVSFLLGHLNAAGRHFSVLGNVVIGTAFWTWTPSILLGRRVDWRRLLPAGLITALLFAAAGIWAAVFVPDRIASYTHRYGLVGVALALVSYLAVLGLMVVTGIVMERPSIRAGRAPPSPVTHRSHTSLPAALPQSPAMFRRPSLAAVLGAAALALAAAAAAVAPRSASAQSSQTIAVEPFTSKISAYAGLVVWSHWDAAGGAYRLMDHYRGRSEVLPIAPRRVPFDVDLGPDARGRVVAVYSRCSRERAVWVLGADTPTTLPSGCVLYRYDFTTRREGRIGGIVGSGSFYLPTIWHDEIAYVRTRGSGAPELFAQPLTAPRRGRIAAVALPGGSSGGPGPVSLDLDQVQLAFSWQTLGGGEISSTIYLDTLPVSPRAAATSIAADAEAGDARNPGFLDFPSFASGSLYYGQFDGSSILPAGDAFERVTRSGTRTATATAPHALRGQVRDRSTTYALYGAYAGQFSSCGLTGCALIAITGLRYR